METLQEIIDKSRGFNVGEYIHLRSGGWLTFFRERFSLSNMDSNIPYLIIYLENMEIVRIGFSMNIWNYIGLSIVPYLKENQTFFIKDLTAEKIDYYNFRQYKQMYINEFIKSK